MPQEARDRGRRPSPRLGGPASHMDGERAATKFGLRGVDLPEGCRGNRRGSSQGKEAMTVDVQQLRVAKSLGNCATNIVFEWSSWSGNALGYHSMSYEAVLQRAISRRDPIRNADSTKDGSNEHR